MEFQIAHLGLRAHPIAFHFELGTVEEFCILKVLEFRITKGDKAGNTRPEKPFSRANVKTTIHPNQFSRHYHAGLPMEKYLIS